MASIRMQLMTTLVARLATLPGWSARLRDVENESGTGAVQCVVYPVSEDKRLATNDSYIATLQVGIYIEARSENASATLDGGNPFRYLDRLLVLAEELVHQPDLWGAAPGFTDVVVNGHELDQAEGDPTSVEAFLRLTFTYRHSYLSPETV
jgi:hypothetical protein